MTSSDLWTVENGIWCLRAGRLSARLNPVRPGDGIVDVRIDDVAVADMHVLGVELPGGVSDGEVDCYVRGGDLIATYAETTDRPLRAQTYWRASLGQSGALASIELIASVQTSLLDACPRLATTSVAGSTSAIQLRDDLGGERALDAPRRGAAPSEPLGDLPCFLLRLAGVDATYVEMTAPDESVGSSLTRVGDKPGSAMRLSHQLFAERLEKGVILRARVLGVFLDRAGDVTAAVRQYEAFLAEAPPLTT